MASVRRAAEKSIRAVETGDPRRVEHIRSVTNPAKRAGLVAVHKLASQYPTLTATALRLGPNIPNLTLLSTNGWASDVYKLGDDTVLKVNKDSVGLSRRKRRLQADRMRAEHQALVDYVGPAILPHTVEIGPDPKERTMTAIRILQPYVDVDFLKLNVEMREIPELAARLRQAKADCPTLLDEVETLVSGSRTLYTEAGLSTDIMGINNVGIGVDSNRLVVVDSQPVTPQHRTTQEKIASFFDNLEVALVLAI